MGFNIETPPTLRGTEEQKLAQMQSYLFRLAQRLNMLDGFEGGGGSGALITTDMLADKLITAEKLADGLHDMLKGARGEPGTDGPAGEGVPAGGTAGQVLTKTASGTAWQNAPAGGIQIGKLWENASPSSSFSPQTVSVNAIGCAFLLVEMKYRNDLTSGALFLAPIGKKFGARQVSSVSVSNPQYASRFIEARTNGVVFGEGYDQGPTTTQDNAYAIPTVIYGVKGAS